MSQIEANVRKWCYCNGNELHFLVNTNVALCRKTIDTSKPVRPLTEYHINLRFCQDCRDVQEGMK